MIGEFREQSEEELGKPKRESGFSKIIGIGPEGASEILEEYKKAFEQHLGKNIENCSITASERNKTPEEIETIESVLDNIKPFVEQYCGVPLNVILNHIHILEREKLDSRVKMITEGEDAYYLPQQQFIAIFDSGDNLKNSQLLVHELLHFNSFQSLEKISTGVKMGNLGFEKFHYDQKGKNDEVYFHRINEAITEELTKRFDKQYFASTPHISEKVKERNQFISEKLRTNPEDKDILEYVSLFSMIDLGFGKARIEGRSTRLAERKEFNELIKHIYSKNKDRFDSLEDIFDIFAKAAMNGEFEEIKKLVEKTDGKGSFKRLGVKTMQKMK